MSKVITFSRVFPAYHPKAGQPTFFVEKIWKGLWDASDNPYLGNYQQEYDNHFGIEQIINVHQFLPKVHTVRAGNRWKAGDYFSPRVWSDKPYNSPQIIIAPDIKIENVWSFEITPTGSKCCIFIDSISKPFNLLDEVAKNDGLTREDFNHWFSTKQIRDNGFKGQVICWNKNIEY